jgi:tRNA(Ile)-lysidine synthase
MLPLQQFLDYINNNALFTAQDKILLAVSGGKDSALMVQLFKLAGFQFSIAHCNFNLREDESQRDEAFVKLLAHSLEVPFYVAHFETKDYAEENQLSIQMAARKLRYDWFEKIRSSNGYQVVALAHHQNDSIETLLLNLTRGTGISGMHGILPKRDHLIRPLLFLTRQQIDLLIEENDIDFVTDGSNESTKYARNKIRLNVIPHLLEINPNLTHTFEQNIARFAATEEVLKMVVEQHRKQLFSVEDGIVKIPIEGVINLKPQKLLLFELLKPFNFNQHLVDEILQSLHKASGTSFYSATHRATIDRSHLLLSEIAQPTAENHFFIHPTDEFVIVGTHKISLFYTDSNLVEANANKAFIDLSKLIFPLIVRFKQDGDRFMPLGMRHGKKLSDFFIDQKIPVPQKEKVPLLINGNGEIIWVVGLRQDNRYKVNVTTKKVAIFELSNL